MSRQLAYDEIVDGGRSIRDAHGRIRPRPLAMDSASPRGHRRLGRDEGELEGEEQEKWFELLAQLPPEEREELYREFKARLDGEEGEDRRRARDRRISRDEPPQFRGRPTTGGTPVSVPDPEALDRRRRVAADSSGKIPTRDELWPARRGAADARDLPTFETLFPGAARRG